MTDRCVFYDRRAPKRVSESRRHYHQLLQRYGRFLVPPGLEFHATDALEFSSDEEFDYILLSDLVNDLPDVQALLSRLHQFTHPRTRLVMNFFNNLWRPVLAGAEAIGAKAPTPPQNWLSTQDMKNLLHLAGWEVIKTNSRILWPVRTPLLEPFLNRWLAPLFRPLCLTVSMVA